MGEGTGVKFMACVDEVKSSARANLPGREASREANDSLMACPLYAERIEVACALIQQCPQA